MGIEAIGSAVGSLGRFGVEITAPTLPILNEGPVGGSFLENTMTIAKPSDLIGSKFNSLIGPSVPAEPAIPDLGGISRSAQELSFLQPVTLFTTILNEGSISKSFLDKSVVVTEPTQPAFSGSEMVQAAEDWLKTVRVEPEVVAPRVEPQVVPLSIPKIERETVPVPAPNIIKFPKPKIIISPALEPLAQPQVAFGVQTGNQVEVKNKATTKVTPAVSTQPAVFEQTEPLIEEVQVIKEEAMKTDEEEQIEKTKLGLVEDRHKTETREAELDQASELVAVEAQILGIEGIEGWRIINKLVPQHTGDRSETLNEEDPQNTLSDGSWESAKTDIKARKFTSLEEAKEVTFAINRKYRPERRGEDDDITEEEHQRVHREHKHSSKKPLQILERRIVKKKMQLLGQSAGVNTNPPQGWTGWTTETSKETSLEDYPVLELEEVFRK